MAVIHKPKLVGTIDKSRKLSRMEWVKACKFHTDNETDVIRELGNRIQNRLGDSSGKVIALFDLDSTLYEVQPRTFKILQEWVASAESRQHPVLREALAKLTLDQVGYSLLDTFTHLGMSVDKAEEESSWKDLKDFWIKRFFTSEYVLHDRPYENAVKTVTAMHMLGADIIYLTGRDQPGMGEGTRKALQRDHFPFNVDRTHLLLKMSFAEDDLRHKKNAGQYIRDMGFLAGSLENEPRNLVALYAAFPEAMHVYFHSICSDAPTYPCQGLYMLKRFPG